MHVRSRATADDGFISESTSITLATAQRKPTPHVVSMTTADAHRNPATEVMIILCEVDFATALYALVVHAYSIRSTDLSGHLHHSVVNQ